MSDGKFATCLNCMDGRVQMPVIQWITKEYSIDYVDMITEAGIDGLLAREDAELKGIITKVRISLDKHGSKKIFIVGHADCAGNPVDEATHHEHIISATKRLKALTGNFPVIGLWCSESLEVQKIFEG